jgi:uncharacterized protein with NRDE domain
MCLLVLAWRLHPRHDLLVAANRDEFHARPAAALDRWAESPEVVAGRDLAGGGTWLGVTTGGRFAAITNWRESPPGSAGPTRGALTADFLRGAQRPGEYLAALEPHAERYAGFNLLLADDESLWYASNRAARFATRLEPGVHGLSNHLLGTDWPKVRHSVQALRAGLDRGDAGDTKLFDHFAARSLAEAAAGGDDAGTGASARTPPHARPHADSDADAALPFPANTGPFIAGADYGTRCTTVVRRDAGGLRITERRFGPRGVALGSTGLHVARAAPA